MEKEEGKGRKVKEEWKEARTQGSKEARNRGSEVARKEGGKLAGDFLQKQVTSLASFAT